MLSVLLGGGGGEGGRDPGSKSGSQVPGTNCLPVTQKGPMTPAKACNVSQVQLSSCLYDLQLFTQRARYRFTLGTGDNAQREGWGCYLLF